MPIFFWEMWSVRTATEIRPLSITGWPPSLIRAPVSWRASNWLKWVCPVSEGLGAVLQGQAGRYQPDIQPVLAAAPLENSDRHQDRKSTRLNSSHVAISYAVFCLK